MKAIQLEGVTKSFRGSFGRRFEALKGISLEVAQGEVFGFVGQNGAGKSTTIKILTGALQPDAGAARLFDVPVSDHHARTGLGYVPENAYLYDYLTPLEVLMMGSRLHKVRVDRLEQHCMHWLERFSLGAAARKRIRSFSKGMAQRTALAHAFAVQPRLLILDEPLSGLDPVGRREVVDIMLEYKQQGGTLFFSSHVLHDVERLADRFGLIHRGELRAVQTPAEILESGQQGLVVRYRGESPLPGSVEDGRTQWCLNVESHAAWAVFRELESRQAVLVSVSPAVTLESAFLDFVRANTPTQEPAA